jgi:hypothetical protein
MVAAVNQLKLKAKMNFKMGFVAGKLRKKMLRMDVLLQFAAFALFLWILVANSSVASSAFNTILTSLRTSVVAIFNEIGTQ